MLAMLPGSKPLGFVEFWKLQITADAGRGLGGERSLHCQPPKFPASSFLNLNKMHLPFLGLLLCKNNLNKIPYVGSSSFSMRGM